MLTLAATRFTAETWEQNAAYRRRKGFVGCVYGVPRLLARDILTHAPVMVVEMNNTARRVEGIGMVQNAVHAGRAWISPDWRLSRVQIRMRSKCFWSFTHTARTMP